MKVSTHAHLYVLIFATILNWKFRPLHLQLITSYTQPHRWQHETIIMYFTKLFKLKDKLCSNYTDGWRSCIVYTFKVLCFVLLLWNNNYYQSLQMGSGNWVANAASYTARKMRNLVLCQSDWEIENIFCLWPTVHCLYKK